MIGTIEHHNSLEKSFTSSVLSGSASVTFNCRLAQAMDAVLGRSLVVPQKAGLRMAPKMIRSFWIGLSCYNVGVRMLLIHLLWFTVSLGHYLEKATLTQNMCR